MSSTFDAIRNEEENLLFRTYARYPIAVVRGQGSRLWDCDGKEYIDLLAGIAVTGLGHCNEELAETMAAQARKLIHVSNLFYQEEQLALAKRISARPFSAIPGRKPTRPPLNWPGAINSASKTGKPMR